VEVTRSSWRYTWSKARRSRRAAARPFEQALREDHLVPVCFCSAERAWVSRTAAGAGATGAESGEAIRPVPQGEGADAVRVAVSPDPAKHVIRTCSRSRSIRSWAKLGIFRVHQGTVKAGAQLWWETRASHQDRAPLPAAGQEHIEVPQASLATLRRAEDRRAALRRRAARLARRDHTTQVGRIPPPMLGLAIRAEKRGDEQKLSESLHRLVAEDPASASNITMRRTRPCSTGSATCTCASCCGG